MAIPEGKIFDLEKMELVDKPQAEIKPTETATEEEPVKEEVKPDVAAEVTSEEEQEPPATEEEPKKEEEKKEEEPLEQIGIDDFVKEKYAEKLGVENEVDLDAKLEELISISLEYDDLKKELATLKATADQPKFSSDQEKKAYEFLKEFDITNMGEGMQTLARIVTMDIDKADPRILLEERFIVEHPELTREESLRKFNRDYTKKYVVKQDDFDSEEAYKEELADLEIDKKLAVAKAKDFLSKKQKEFKSEAKQSPEAAKENPVVAQNITKTIKVLDDYIAAFDSITYAPTENEQDNFTIKFTKEQKSKIYETTKGWVSNPASYDSKGELIDGFDPDSRTMQVAYFLFGEDMMAKVYAHVMSQADIKRAEDIAKTKPNRESKTAVDKVSGVSEEKQWEMIARQKKAERSKKAPIHF